MAMRAIYTESDGRVLEYKNEQVSYCVLWAMLFLCGRPPCPEYGSQEIEEGRKCERELKVYLNRGGGISGD